MAKLRPGSFPFTKSGNQMARKASKQNRNMAGARRAKNNSMNYSAQQNAYPGQVRPISIGNTRGDRARQPEGKLTTQDYAGITSPRQVPNDRGMNPTRSPFKQQGFNTPLIPGASQPVMSNNPTRGGKTGGQQVKEHCPYGTIQNPDGSCTSDPGIGVGGQKAPKKTY